ncbi:MAG TPA: hypothetical protein VJ777_19655 [Mycobacterium sp.]|nr:hypothetical protein [Mycobacterium sp.]HKQ84853.1 hypothetical protein [Steroidobacteraceae bacterium]
MKHVLAVGALGLGLYLSIPSAAVAASADTTIDVTKNPGCGVKGLTSEQKVQRNHRLAELFFQAYVEAPKLGALYSWNRHGCFTPDVALYSWLSGPEAPPQVGSPMVLDPKFLQNEWKMLRKAMPDFGVAPGSLKIFPWDEGVTFRMDYAGHTPEGVLHRVWETATILVNDEGRITYWEFWSDTKAFDALFKAAFGLTSDDLKTNPQKFGERVMNYQEGKPTSAQ